MARYENFHNNLQNKAWELSRRNFVKLAIMSGILSQIPFASSCISENSKGDILVNINGIDYNLELKQILC